MTDRTRVPSNPDDGPYCSCGDPWCTEQEDVCGAVSPCGAICRLTPGHSRATSLSPPERFVLDQWAEQVASAFGYGFPVLVGSVARAERHWRDVDVRLVLKPEAFTDVTGDDPERHSALNVALSWWGRHVTGLPIDFQFQPDGEDHDGACYPLGIAVKGDVYRHAYPNEKIPVAASKHDDPPEMSDV